MQVTDSGEASAVPMLEQAVRIPVRLLESATPADAAGARALFDSILQWGILQPLIVRRIGGTARYEVLAGRKRLASAVSAGFSEVPCVVFEGSDADAAAVAAASNISTPLPQASPATPASSPLLGVVVSELQATRSAVAANLRLAQTTVGGLRPLIARELVDVELQRACWILDGLQVFNADERGSRVPVRLAPLLRSVIEAFQPECRLSAITVQLLVEPSDLALTGDEAQLRGAINCAIGATLTSMHSARQADGVLSVSVTAPSGGCVVSIAQNVLPFQELARLRSGWRRGEVPPGDSALTCFGLEAAQRALERQSGRLELRPDSSSSGGTIVLKPPPVSGLD
jgi:hypothetical protein